VPARGPDAAAPFHAVFIARADAFGRACQSHRHLLCVCVCVCVCVCAYMCGCARVRVCARACARALCTQNRTPEHAPPSHTPLFPTRLTSSGAFPASALISSASGRATTGSGGAAAAGGGGGALKLGTGGRTTGEVRAVASSGRGRMRRGTSLVLAARNAAERDTGVSWREMSWGMRGKRGEGGGRGET